MKSQRFASIGLAAIALIVMVATTVTFGQAPTASAGPQVTFTKDVAPILYKNCIRCHRPGEIAPMSLFTYEDARPWAASMKNRVSKREMPPWYLDKNIGIQKYKNDPSLSDTEIATIVKWVDTGSVKGNMTDMPKLPDMDELPSVWRIGTPDVVVKYPAYHMPAAGPDLYGTLTAPFGTTEDRYIKAIQTRVVDIPSRKIVHHALSFAVPPNADADLGDDSGGNQGGDFLIEYASGKNATFYEEGSGQMLPAGMNARVSYHLHSIGEQVDAKIELGIVFWPKGYVPKHRTWSKQLGQESAADLDIPANKNNPDSKNWVGAGTGRTIDEMGFSWIGWYDITNDEYKTLLAERKAAQTRTSNDN